MFFRYRAVRSDGTLENGALSAASPAELDTLLQRRGLELLSCRRNRLADWRPQRPPPPQEVVHFCFHLMQLLQAGLPLLDALGDVRDMTSDRTFRPHLTQLIEDVASGQTLAQALQAPPPLLEAVFVSLVRAGEQSGTLAETFLTLHHTLAWQQQLLAHTRRTLLYPAFVATAVSACAAFLLIYLVPQLQQIMQTMGLPLPLHSRLLFALADSLAAYWFFLPLPIGLALFALLLVRRFARGERLLARLVLRLPLIGAILRKLLLARLSNTLGVLYAASIPLLDALQLGAAAIGNAHLRQATEDAHAAVVAGQTLAEAFAQSQAFPPLMIRMLQLGERTGRLDTCLLDISRNYQEEAEAAIDQLQRLIEPALTLFFGLLLGWIALAIFGPLQDLIGRVAT